MPRATAKFRDTVVAETDTWESVEGNVYFPLASIKDQSVLTPSDTSTFCPWKGTASYYDLKLGDTVVRDAAWYYAEPYDAAKNIRGHVAFYKNKVEIHVE
ncbi:hypothetical protein VTO42DRAFT_6904 [Malbranchea cinnamomea]